MQHRVGASTVAGPERNKKMAELAYFTRRMLMATAYMHNFTESEIGEAIQFVEETFCMTRADRQFEAVLASVCRILSSHAARYGPFGFTNEMDVGGRSSFKYWLDEIHIEKLASYVEEYAKMPPELEFMIVMKTDKACASCKAKPDTGEVRAAVFGDWKPNGVNPSGSIVAFRKDKHYCLAANCICKIAPATQDAAVFHNSVPLEARAVVEAAFVAPADTPKPTDLFKKRKRAWDDEDERDRFEFSEDAKRKIATLAAAEKAAAQADEEAGSTP